MSANQEHSPCTHRRWLVLLMLGLGGLALAWRAVDLQVLNHDFLLRQGDARHLRVVEVPTHRGVIHDRDGEPLAMSIPIDSVWANPGELLLANAELPRLARTLELSLDGLKRKLAASRQREFIYLKRHIHPDVAERVRRLRVPGVALQREYHRYYPASEVTAQLLGYTDIDDVGLEGLEYAYDDWLRGTPGFIRVVRDGRGRIIEELENLKAPRPGNDLTLSIDRRLQFLAYRELKAAVLKHNAVAGSLVLLDVQTGEVLAMVNQPSYNPNKVSDRRGGKRRNRAVTDLFEPGSTIKPFIVAAALQSGEVSPATRIDTSPGTLRIGRHLVRDARNYGLIDVGTIIAKSSNVGASKLALGMTAETLWDMLDACGFGTPTASGFPGESGGMLAPYDQWRDVGRATLAYGYGLSVTPLQLARAYAVLAADGVRRPVSFLKQEEIVAGERVMPVEVARQVRAMMERVVSPKGTGRRAAVAGYRVAGKTGTARKLKASGYGDDSYFAVFGGFAPASRPRLAMVVMIDEPRNEDYYGGVVAAPVFSRVMSGALRLLNIAPDAPSLIQAGQAGRGGAA